MARSTALNWEKDLKERIEAQRAEVPTPKLFEMMVRCMKALDGETEVPEFLSEARLSAREMSGSWPTTGSSRRVLPRRKEVFEQSRARTACIETRAQGVSLISSMTSLT